MTEDGTGQDRAAEGEVTGRSRELWERLYALSGLMGVASSLGAREAPAQLVLSRPWMELEELLSGAELDSLKQALAEHAGEGPAICSIVRERQEAAATGLRALCRSREKADGFLLAMAARASLNRPEHYVALLYAVNGELGAGSSDLTSKRNQAEREWWRRARLEFRESEVHLDVATPRKRGKEAGSGEVTVRTDWREPFWNYRDERKPASRIVMLWTWQDLGFRMVIST